MFHMPLADQTFWNPTKFLYEVPLFHWGLGPLHYQIDPDRRTDGNCRSFV